MMKNFVRAAISSLTVNLLISLITLFGCGGGGNDGGKGTATVTGTITLPETVNCTQWLAAIDSDKNGDNGFVSYASGTCDGRTSIGYTVNDVPSGTYYVYAVAWVVGDPSSAPIAGDYIGFYPSGPSPASPNAVGPASGSVNFGIPLMLYGGPPGNMATIMGAITLPAPVNQKCAAVGLDYDTNPFNGLAQSNGVDLSVFLIISGTKMNYMIYNVPPGTYYLSGIADREGNSAACDLANIRIDAGDYAGFYGGSGTNPPAAANITIGSSGTYTYDFTLGPIAGAGATVSGMITLPASVDSKCVAVALDNDNNPGNGLAQSYGADLVVSDVVSGTTMNFSIVNVPPGTYYLGGIADPGGNSSSCDPAYNIQIDTGDYWGYYGGSGVNPPAAANVAISSDGTYSYSFSLATISSMTGTVSGTITLPAPVDSKCVGIGLDYDADPFNGLAQSNGVELSVFQILSGTTMRYTIGGVPWGSYFLIAGADQGGNSTSCDLEGLTMDIGDYVGFYGGSGTNPPSSANVTMTPGGSYTYDFTLGTFAPAGDLQTISLSPSEASLVKGLTQQFTATGSYSDGTSMDTSSSVSWWPRSLDYRSYQEFRE